MSEQHLAKGSPLPPYTGKLRIYSMRFCPYAQRAILALNAKNVPYEVVNVNLKSKPEWLTSKSPLGKVPALEIEENVSIYESLIVAEYVDEKYPGTKLSSSDPFRKAMDKIIIENFNKVITSYYKALFSKGDLEDSVATDFYQGLDDFQSHLKQRGTKFLSGDDAPGFVDYMVWPWFERIELVTKFSNGRLILDKSKYALLFDWMEAMKQDPAVQKHFLSLEKHTQFIESYATDSPEYDALNKGSENNACAWRPKKKQ